MTPQTVSLILAAIVIVFVIHGLAQGIIHMIGSVFGLFLGIAVASRWDTSAGAWLSSSTGWSTSVCTVIGFVLILLIFTRVFGFALHILEKTFGFMKIPLVGLANRLAGGLLGFFEGVFVVGSTLIIISSLPFAGASSLIAASSVGVALIGAAKILLPLVPKQIRDLYLP